eukprot:m.315323 g.315323  ORF g.315323 m.315323 type:complete len:264 (-) comp23067_c0_seq14:621-1412(-)
MYTAGLKVCASKMSDPLLCEQKLANPGAEFGLIRCPFRALVVGASGSGKTHSFLRDVVLAKTKDGKTTHRMPNKLVIWCAPEASLRQPKLQAAAEVLDKRAQKEGLARGFVAVPCDDGVVDSEKIEQILNAGFEAEIPMLLVFDDLVSVNPKARRYIASCFMNCRHRNTSVAELRQRIFSSDGSAVRDARLSCNLFMLGAFSTEGEVEELAKQLVPKEERELFLKRYRHCIAEPHGFLLADLQSPKDSPLRYRKSGISEGFKP